MAGTDDMACCGLICRGCDMQLASDDPELARSIADWFERELGQAVAPEKIHCRGCLGPRAEHWSSDCWILACCADEHGLTSCADCPEFACARLVEWAAGSPRYAAALARLRRRREGGARE